MVDKKWVAFFSQTGSEILNISKRLGKFPDTIICNGFLDKTNKELLKNKSVIYTRTKPTVNDYKQFIGSDKDTLVTLHQCICTRVQRDYTSGDDTLSTRQ